MKRKLRASETHYAAVITLMVANFYRACPHKKCGTKIYPFREYYHYFRFAWVGRVIIPYFLDVEATHILTIPSQHHRALGEIDSPDDFILTMDRLIHETNKRYAVVFHESPHVPHLAATFSPHSR